MKITYDRFLKIFETETVLGLTASHSLKRQPGGRIISNGWLSFILHHEAFALDAEKIHE